MASLFISIFFVFKEHFLNKKIFLFLNIVTFLGLGGCQHFSKNYCEDTNWRKEAFLYALSGESRDIFKNISKKCKAFKVDVDQQVFNEGFDEGAAQFCSPPAGFDYGKGGYLYKGTCKNLNEKEYMKSYIQGRLVFLNEQFKKTNAQLEESNARLWRKKNEYELEANTNPALASRAYDELESYRAENERIKSDLEAIKEMISELQKESTKY